MSRYDEDGLDLMEIFCSRCLVTDDDETNDIVLCDMPDCNRAYHQHCLNPPLEVREEDEDEEWFCPSCRVREELLDVSSNPLFSFIPPPLCPSPSSLS